MYMSRIQLNPERRETMKALAEPNLFHGAVERSLVNGRERTLWRIDRLGGKWYMLMISRSEPDLSAFAAQFGYPDERAKWETRPYDPYLNRITQSSCWRFRLTANPVRHEHIEGGRGRVHAHVTVDQQKAWLLKQSMRCGFTLSEEQFTVTETQWLRFRKQGNEHTVSIKAVSFEGILTVTDPEVFRNTLSDGIGRGKAYGMGMMTVIPLR